MSEQIEQQSIGEIVANDFRTSKVFTEFDIDFCCGGKLSLSEVCMEENLDMQEVLNKIEEIKESSDSTFLNYKDWSLPFLIDYIINVHHKYVLNTLPDLVFYTEKIANVHSQNHPELELIAQKISLLNDELRNHLQEEEELLFPSIKGYVNGKKQKPAKVIKKVIDGMLEDHDIAGSTMDEINKITDGYSIPADGCNTYRAAYETLKKFEEDLHIHVHLENNILFPKTLNLIDIQS